MIDKRPPKLKEYDFRADDCNNATFASRFNELVISGFTWDVR